MTQLLSRHYLFILFRMFFCANSDLFTKSKLILLLARAFSSRLWIPRPTSAIKISMIVQNDVKIPWRAPVYWLTSHPINHSPRDSLYEARIIDAAERPAIDTLSAVTLHSFLPSPRRSLLPPSRLVFPILSLLFPCSTSISFFILSSTFPPSPPGFPRDSPIMTRCWPRKLHQYLRNKLRAARANPFVSRTPGIRASANGIWIIEYPPYPAHIGEPCEYIILLKRSTTGVWQRFG